MTTHPLIYEWWLVY